MSKEHDQPLFLKYTLFAPMANLEPTLSTYEFRILITLARKTDISATWLYFDTTFVDRE